MKRSESHGESAAATTGVAAPAPLALLRFTLGLLQMGGAVFTLTLLGTIGVGTCTIACALLTTALTATSAWFLRPAPR